MGRMGVEVGWEGGGGRECGERRGGGEGGGFITPYIMAS